MFTSLALVAQAIPDPTVDPFNFLTTIVDLLGKGQMPVLAGAILIGIVMLVRKALSKEKFFNTDPGAALLTLLVAVLGALASAVYTGEFTWSGFLDIAKGGLLLGVASAGGFVLIYKKLGPWAFNKLAAWLDKVSPKLGSIFRKFVGLFGVKL